MKIIDMHCDTLWSCWKDRTKSLRTGPNHLNLNLMRQAGGLCQFFALYLDRAKMSTTAPYEIFHQLFRVYEEEMASCKDVILPAYSADHILRNARDGKLSAFLTIEDGSFVENELKRIEEVYDKGVRLITLLWGYPNSLGYPCSDDPAENARELTPLGVQAVEMMNRLGMIVDVSHLSEGGFYHVLRVSKKPFAASHSCAKALCGHKRNLTDDQLRCLGQAGGVVGVNFERSFLRKGSRGCTVDDIMLHLDYMMQKAGSDSVAFGSDFDGIETAGELGDYSGFSMLLDRLERKYPSAVVDKIVGGNVLRIIRDVTGR